MLQLAFMHPLIMFWAISCPPHEILPPTTPFPVLEQCFNFVVGFAFYLHWLWGFNRASTWHVGPQLGDMEYVVNNCETSLQVKLVCSLAYALEDLERAHKPLIKLAYSPQMQIASAQQHPVPSFMFLVPVLAVKVPFLVLLGLQQVSLSSLKQVLDVQDKISSPSMATSLDHHIEW